MLNIVGYRHISLVQDASMPLLDIGVYLWYKVHWCHCWILVYIIGTRYIDVIFWYRHISLVQDALMSLLDIGIFHWYKVHWCHSWISAYIIGTNSDIDVTIWYRLIHWYHCYCWVLAYIIRTRYIDVIVGIDLQHWFHLRRHDSWVSCL